MLEWGKLKNTSKYQSCCDSSRFAVDEELMSTPIKTLGEAITMYSIRMKISEKL